MSASQLLSLPLMLFLISIWGIFTLCRNIITVLMAIEILLLSVNLSFIGFSVYLDEISGQAFALFILTIAAAEAAIALAIIVIYYRLRGIISLSMINYLKG